MEQKLELFLFYIIKFIILLFPVKIRYKIAEGVGVLAYKLIKNRRKITHKNIKIAFPISDEEVKRIAISSYKNIGKTFFELLWLKELKVELKGKEKLEKAIKKDKGIIFLSLHLDNWEVLGKAMSTNGFSISAVAKKQKNEKINKIINDIREGAGEGIKVIQKGKNTSSRELIKALKSKAIIGLISDQYMEDVEVDFFGKKTYAPAGAATFGVRFGIPVLMMYSVRNADNSHTVFIEDEIELLKTGDKKEDIIKNTQLFMKEIEKPIQKYPEQWFWQHKRWRN